MEDYGPFREITLSASCPAANALLLGSREVLTFREREDGAPGEPGDPWLSWLLPLRQRMLALAEDIQARSQALMASLPPREGEAYYSMIHFSAMASMNLLKMHLYAGKNQHYAAQGKVIAKRYAALAEEVVSNHKA